jgi:hypothetical protein
MSGKMSLTLFLLMLDSDVLGLSSEFSMIYWSSFLGETADEVRTENSLLGVIDPDLPNFFMPSLSPSPEVAAVVDPWNWSDSVENLDQVGKEDRGTWTRPVDPPLWMGWKIREDAGLPRRAGKRQVKV